MGVLEWLILAGGLTVGLVWWLRRAGRARGAQRAGEERQQEREPEPARGPAEAASGAPDESDESVGEPEDEEAAAAFAAQKGPAGVDELVQGLLADYRNDDDVICALPLVVEALGAPGAEALADSLARLSSEVRPTILESLEEVAEEVGKPLVAPLLSRVTSENAQGVGRLLGAVLRGASDGEEREELGLRALVAALEADAGRRKALQEVLHRAVAPLDAEVRRDLLFHKKAEVRAASVAIALQIKEKTLQALARQEDACVRIALLGNHGLWDDDRELLVQPYFSDPSPEVRVEACLRAGYIFDDEVERLREDPDRAVALVARSVLEDDGMLALIDGALSSGKPALRLAAVRAAGAQLEEKDALKVFAALQLDGTAAELRAFLDEFPAEELGSLEQLARFARTDPPAEVAEALLLALSYNDEVEGAPDLPQQLLDRSLPPRVRRVGFEALLTVDEGRARRLEAVLVPDEPQLADFLWALSNSASGGDDAEKALYRRLKGSSCELLAAFGEDHAGS